MDRLIVIVDSVNHKLLIDKLRKYNVNDKLLKWFHSYLCNRKQLVKINQKFSDPITPTSGVQQGSNLGALLYIIYINDLKNIVFNSKFLIYIVDLKIFKEISNDRDIKAFKSDIKRLHDCNYFNSLRWSLDKCYIMIYDKKKMKDRTHTKYKIGI